MPPKTQPDIEEVKANANKNVATLAENTGKNQIEETVPNQPIIAEKKAVDPLSFLTVRKEELLKKLEHKNQLRREALKQAEILRDEVNALLGAGREVDELIKQWHALQGAINEHSR